MGPSKAAFQPPERVQVVLLIVAAAFAGAAPPAMIASKAVFGMILAVSIGAAALAVLPRVVWAEVLKALRRPLPAAVAIMIASWLISVLVSLDPLRSLTAWGWTAGFVLCGWLLFGALKDSDRAIYHAQRAIVITAIVCALITLFGIYVWYEPLDPFGAARLREPARLAPKDEKLRLAAAVPGAGRGVGELAARWRLSGLIYLPLAAAIIPRVYSKAGMLGVGTLVFAVAVTAVLEAPAWARGPGAGDRPGRARARVRGGAGSLPTQAAGQGASGYRFSKRAIELHRQAIWGFAIHHAVKAPLFGHGPDTPFLPASS